MYYSVVKNDKEVNGYTRKGDAMKLFKSIKKVYGYDSLYVIAIDDDDNQTAIAESFGGGQG